MEDWKKRMISEERELCRKINKLSRFLNNEQARSAADLSSEELLLMIDQLDLMQRYDAILRHRMEMHNLIVEVIPDGS